MAKAKDTKKLPKQVIIKGVIWTPDTIKAKLQTSDQAVKNALLRLYGWQTADEQQEGATREQNGKGFNGADSEILSSFSEQLKTKGWLSQKQINIARKRVLKYTRQIFTYMADTQQATFKQFGL